ncbi:MAG: hypothetical protein LBF51_04160 [Zoogloeaceae bacterium]|nr:hypothetical protein [Zoogloeaceae bacterium]
MPAPLAGGRQGWEILPCYDPGANHAARGAEESGNDTRDFAQAIATPLATLRDWEQGRFEPPGGVFCLLKLIARHPGLAGELAA